MCDALLETTKVMPAFLFHCKKSLFTSASHIQSIHELCRLGFFLLFLSTGENKSDNRKIQEKLFLTYPEAQSFRVGSDQNIIIFYFEMSCDFAIINSSLYENSVINFYQRQKDRGQKNTCYLLHHISATTPNTIFLSFIFLSWFRS